MTAKIASAAVTSVAAAASRNLLLAHAKPKQGIIMHLVCSFICFFPYDTRQQVGRLLPRFLVENVGY